MCERKRMLLHQGRARASDYWIIKMIMTPGIVIA